MIPLAPGRTNILALWGEPRVLFTTHLDVVPPELPVLIEDGRIAARGACDAKGQIAAQLGAIETLLKEGLSGLAWLGVAGEESDSLGAQAALELKPIFSSCLAIVNGEPTNCALATGQKGYLRAKLSCAGLSAHGSTPELGRNAITELIAWLSALARAEPGHDPRLGREAWNLGLIRGGSAANVVPDEAWAELSLRTVPGGRLRYALEAAMPANARLETPVDESHDYFDLVPGLPSASVPFGSDLPALRALAPKAAALLAGPGNPALAHTRSEELSLEELRNGIALFAAIGRHYLSGPTTGVQL
jgi:acetylornithine deacetylase